MMIIPYRLTINSDQQPIVNAFIIGVTAVVFVFSFFVDTETGIFESMVLRDWDPAGMLGSLFLHGDILHLLGNMIFLWVFGNAICATVGNAIYPVVYLFLGLCASVMHLVFSGAPAIGASGAINGIVGMAFVLYPVNKLDCAYVLPFIGLVKYGKFTVKSFWMIALWFFLDIVGILLGGGHVAYWAHVGGFVSGMAISGSIIGFKWAKLYDPTLFDVVRGRTEDPELERQGDLEARVIALKAGAMLAPVKTGRKRELPAHSADDIHTLWTQGGEDDQPGPTTAPLKEAPRPIPQPPPAFEKIAPVQLQSVPSTLKLRLLRIVPAAGQWTCYFANDGDGVSDLRLDHHEGLKAEIHPHISLKRKEPCWMKLVWTGQGPGPALDLNVTYDDQAGGRGTQRITVRPS